MLASPAVCFQVLKMGFSILKEFSDFSTFAAALLKAAGAGIAAASAGLGRGCRGWFTYPAGLPAR